MRSAGHDRLKRPGHNPLALALDIVPREAPGLVVRVLSRIRVLNRRALYPNAGVMPRGPHSGLCGGQGVAREGESEGLAEQFWAVIEEMNRSAKVRERSSLHYGGEGVLHPPWRT